MVKVQFLCSLEPPKHLPPFVKYASFFSRQPTTLRLVWRQTFEIQNRNWVQFFGFDIDEKQLKRALLGQCWKMSSIYSD